jgi:hypothetical protein
VLGQAGARSRDRRRASRAREHVDEERDEDREDSRRHTGFGAASVVSVMGGAGVRYGERFKEGLQFSCGQWVWVLLVAASSSHSMTER